MVFRQCSCPHTPQGSWRLQKGSHMPMSSVHRTYLYPAESETQEPKKRANVNLCIVSLSPEIYLNHNLLFHTTTANRPQSTVLSAMVWCCYIDPDSMRWRNAKNRKGDNEVLVLSFLSPVSVVMCIRGLDFAGRSWDIRGSLCIMDLMKLSRSVFYSSGLADRLASSSHVIRRCVGSDTVGLSVGDRNKPQDMFI